MPTIVCWRSPQGWVYKLDSRKMLFVFYSKREAYRRFKMQMGVKRAHLIELK